jgi:HlyD family secretion protein
MNALFNKLKTIPFTKTIPVALVGLLVMGYYLSQQSIGVANQAPQRTPATSPFKQAITGVGIIEPVNESTAVAPHFNGKVLEVYVKEGDKVTKGQPLMKLDTAILQAQYNRYTSEIQAARARTTAQQARLNRLGQEPRGTTLPPLRARVKSIEAQLAKELDSLKRLEGVPDSRAVSEQQVAQQRLTVAALQAQVAEAKAALNEKEAGAWQPDIQEAQATLTEQQAQVNALEAQRSEINIQLQQATVVAPTAGVVLQVNAKAGETLQLMQMGGSSEPAIMIGDTSTLQVRVDVDEVLASNVRPGMQAIAFVKGDSQLRMPLVFDHLEPFMVPKKSLTGSTAERNDVRVLQLVYRFTPPTEFTVYPGQQVDVYLNALTPIAPPADTKDPSEEQAMETPPSNPANVSTSSTPSSDHGANTDA